MPDREIGCKKEVSGMREAYIASALHPRHKENPQRFNLANGDIEKVLKRPSIDSARRALIWANLFYGSRRLSTVRYTKFSSIEVPPNQRGWKGWTGEVEKYVKL